jgi:hypothetical protein
VSEIVRIGGDRDGGREGAEDAGGLGEGSAGVLIEEEVAAEVEI